MCVGLGLSTDLDIWSLHPTHIEAEVLKLWDGANSSSSGSGADGIVISCSALRMLQPGFIDRLEKMTGVPVVTSMQVRPPPLLLSPPLLPEISHN